jgi:hypothetical protein
MFELLLSPINAVRVWMAAKVYEAAQAGAREGLQRFAADFGSQFEALPAPAATPTAALEAPAPEEEVHTTNGRKRRAASMA